MGRRSRRKIGSRGYKNYSQEMLEVAVDLVKKKEITSLEAEKRFFIPRRTIENKVKGLHMNPPGGQQRLSDAEEKDIVDVLIAAADFGSPLSRLDLRILIFEYLNKNRRACLFGNKLPGKWWVKNFLDRHRDKLTERSVQNIKRSRAEKSAEEFENYFENLKHTVKDVPPINILNYDESNLSDNPGSTKCIFKRKVKYPERIINHSKGNISIMFAASADGCLLPVYIVYKSEHLWSNWCLNGPPDARYNRTKSGWFDTTVFEDWFENTVIPWAKKLEGPKVVIGDNLSSHINPNIIRLCEQNDIRFAFLPPNSTHITQPLDVAYFGPLKKCWRQILTEYKIKNPSETQINKGHFPILLKQLLEKIEISNKDNIKAGFKATGIVPLNPNKVMKKLPDFEPETSYKIDIALLDYLKKSKAPDPLKKSAVNRKLKVEPGTSISSLDLETLMANVKKRTQKKNALDNKSKKSKPDKTTKTGQGEVTTLSNIRKLPENQAYEDVRECSALKLTKVDAKPYILDTSKNTQENIDPWTNPEASTSGTCKINKRKASNKKVHQSKRLKVEYNSEVDNDDNYLLRDSSEEETIRSEYEDKKLDAFNERNNIKCEKSVKHEDKIVKNQRKRTKELEKQRNQYNESSTQAKKVKIEDNYSGEQNSDSSEDICLSEYKKRSFDSIMTNQIQTILSEEIDINNIDNFIEIDENGEIMEYETCLGIENNSKINQNKIKNDEVEENVKDTVINENNSQKFETEKTEKRKKITILSEIRNTFENKIVVDTKKLKRVEKTVDLYKSMINKYKENKQTECQMAELKLDLPGTAQNKTDEVKKNTKKLDLPETNQTKTEESEEVENSESPKINQNKTEERKDEENSDSAETNQNKTEDSEEVDNSDLLETNENKTEESEEVDNSDLPETNQNKTEDSEEVDNSDLPETNQNKTEDSKEVDNSDLPETNQNKTEESEEVDNSDLPETNENKTEDSEEVDNSDLPETNQNKTKGSEEVDNSDLPETNQNKTKESKEVEKLDLPETNQNKTEESEEVENSDSPKTNQNKTEESQKVENSDSPETNQNMTEDSEEVDHSDLPETNQNKNEESKEVEKFDLPETNQNKNEERKEVETSDSRETKQNNTEEKKEIKKRDSSKTYQKKTEDDEEVVNRLHLCDANRNDAKEEKSDYDTNRIVINQSVLVRYYIRAKWKYYVGFVEKIDVREQEIFYTVHFLKTIKKPNLKFVVTKYDRDTVPSTSIVKIIQLLSGKKNSEYYLNDNFDEVYF